MTSLNSQESSNDICKLTDKQQAEYHTAYQEYIAQMAQIEVGLGGGGGGMERPQAPYLPGGPEDKAKEADPDGRKPFPKTRSKVTDASDGDAQLDPITEEDEKSEGGSGSARGLLGRRAKGPGPRYHKVPPSDEDEESGDEESYSTPLLSEERRRQEAEAREAQPPSETSSLLPRGTHYLSDSLLDKKESSDSGLRSSGSSSDRSLQDADSEPEKAEPEAEAEAAREPGAAEGSHLMELLEPEVLLRKRLGLPGNLSGLQDAAVMRMSICSEAPSEGSAMASSPEENWPVTAVSNLNRSASSSTLNNNNSANNQLQLQQALHETSTTNTNADAVHSPAIIISPGSTNATTTGSITTTAMLHNDNLRAMQRKRGPSGEEEERESVL